MPRKKLIRTAVGTYHVMTRVNHRREFPISIPECWDIFLRLLRQIPEDFGAEINAFVLMSNHYHLLLKTPLLNIDLIMKRLNREVTRAISTKTGLINHIFGARYRSSISYQPFDTAYVLKYIYRNPAKAGLVSQVEDYPFSTVKNLEDASLFPFLRPPGGEQSGLFRQNSASILSWLNEPLPKEQDELLRKAMKRREFHFNDHHRAQSLVRQLPPPPW